MMRKIMESIINNNLINNKKQLNLVADKGYIKNNNYVNNLRDNYNITLITPVKINSKKENSNADKILLKNP